MQHAPVELRQPLACRIWDPARKCFSFTEAFLPAAPLVDRWTGLFDQQGLPVYERDILRVHYNWRLGWVTALVTRHPKREGYMARATDPHGTSFDLGFYYFADSYLVGNLHQHPNRLQRAREQFSKSTAEPWWLSEIVFPRPTLAQGN